MQFSGTVEIAAPRDRVWGLLMDIERVGQCGPGVESVEVESDTRAKVKAKVGVGFISARFAVDIEFTERTAPERARIKAHGQAPGSAVDGTAEMLLSGPAEGPTTMNWSADVMISGTLASVGARMIEGTASKMIDQTFSCIKAKVEVGG